MPPLQALDRYSKKDRATMGRRLQAARELVGLSQPQVADKLGVTRQAVAKWEVGTLPSEEHRGALAELYGQPVPRLFAELEARLAARRALLEAAS